MNGWDAETEAAQLLNGIGIPTELHYAQMASLDGRQKVKVLLAQALFGHPNIILLDEPPTAWTWRAPNGWRTFWWTATPS